MHSFSDAAAEKQKEVLTVRRAFSSDTAMHYTMALVGGFFAAYGMLGRCDVLGSAQTGNLIHLVLALLGQSFPEVLIRVGAAAVYAAALVLTVLLPKRYGVPLKPVSVGIDCAAVVLLGLIPEGVDSVLALYPAFFAMAFQWNAFPGAEGYTSSPIFSTNNFRQTVTSLTSYCCTHEAQHLKKARFFAGTLLSFHIGVALAWAGTALWGLACIWFCLLPLAACAGEYALHERAAQPQPERRAAVQAARR